MVKYLGGSGGGRVRGWGEGGGDYIATYGRHYYPNFQLAQCSSVFDYFYKLVVLRFFL